MKQIVDNKYLNVFKFSSPKEALIFIDNQETNNILTFDETFGDNYFCYVCHHSLTREKQFVLYFSSYENEDKLNFLFWDEQKIFVLDTGNYIYLINEILNITASFEITTPLVGLYLTKKGYLLLLEEAYLRLVDSNGTILKNESFDLIKDFKIENEQLSILTNSEFKFFDLGIL